jgi:hypothetical protein
MVPDNLPQPHLSTNAYRSKDVKKLIFKVNIAS